jgi:hypothetical protein
VNEMMQNKYMEYVLRPLISVSHAEYSVSYIFNPV